MGAAPGVHLTRKMFLLWLRRAQNSLPGEPAETQSSTCCEVAVDIITEEPKAQRGQVTSPGTLSMGRNTALVSPKAGLSPTRPHHQPALGGQGLRQVEQPREPGQPPRGLPDRPRLLPSLPPGKAEQGHR